MRVLRYLVALLALLAAPAVALAQASTANQVTPGFLSTSGCPSAATTPCFIPYSVTNPMPTTGASTPSGTASNAADGVATSTNNQSSVVYPFLWNGATFDRWKGDATNGAFVNVKTAVPATPATGTGTPTAVTVGASSAQALAAATRTQRLVLQNMSATASMACSLGGTAALNTAGSFQIGPGQMLNLGDGRYIPGDAVNCIASASSTPLTAWSR